MGRRRKLKIVSHRKQSSSNNDDTLTEHAIDESVESHSIPSDDESIGDVVPKAIRGPTRMLDVWDMAAGDFICVKLDEFGRPVGEEAKSLSRFIGSLVRRHQYAPINYKSWKEMPMEIKDVMLKVIESKFEFVPSINDDIREMLKTKMNDKGRTWKHDLKMVFDPGKTEEQVASAIPNDRVDPAQFCDLVHHWFSKEAQKICEINEKNSAKLEDTHCMGTKSLPVMIEEKKSKGVLPERHLVYIDTRTRKDGTIINLKAASVIDEFKKHSHDGETSENTQNSSTWKGDLYSKVQEPEKRGRVRCLGKMPTKNSRDSISEDASFREEFRQMKGLLTNVLKLIQKSFS